MMGVEASGTWLKNRFLMPWQGHAKYATDPQEFPFTRDSRKARSSRGNETNCSVNWSLLSPVPPSIGCRVTNQS
jgi:hypothetical protein